MTVFYATLGRELCQRACHVAMAEEIVDLARVLNQWPSSQARQIA